MLLQADKQEVDRKAKSGGGVGEKPSPVEKVREKLEDMDLAMDETGLAGEGGECGEEETKSDDEIVEPCTPHHHAMYAKIPTETATPKKDTPAAPKTPEVTVVISDEERHEKQKGTAAGSVKGTFKASLF